MNGWKSKGVNLMNVFMTAISICLGVGLSKSAWAKDRWVYSLDGANRPITGCLKLDESGYGAVIMAMNCKKTVVPTMHLCSEGRMVHWYENEAECEKAHMEFVKLYGEHTLATDPNEKPRAPKQK